MVSSSDHTFFLGILTKPLTSSSCTYFRWTLLELAEWRIMAIEIIPWSISTKVWDRAGIELTTPGSADRQGLRYAARYMSVTLWKILMVWKRVKQLSELHQLTFCILMEFPIHIDINSMGLLIVYFKGSQVEFLSCDIFLSLKVVLIILIIGNSVDPVEMQHHAAFYLGLHCLPMYPFNGFQYTKGWESKTFIAILKWMATITYKVCNLSSSSG